MTIKLQKLLSIALFACGAGAISLAAPAHAEYCNNEGRQAWCGGGSTAGNALKQMSCTPFAYKPWSFNNKNGLGETNKNSFCTSKTVKDVAGGPYQSQAWMLNKGNRSKDTSYWVFHGCDGAGIMPDCVGDVLFLERFYGWSKDQSKVWCKGGITIDQVASRTSDPNSNRRQCKFKHPGTGHIYENYEAGIWQWGDKKTTQIDLSKFTSAATGGWSQRAEDAVTSVRNPFPNGETVLYTMTFPWVCTGIGKGGANQNEGDATNGLFTQTNTPGVKCYWDNESGAPQWAEDKAKNGDERAMDPYWPPQMNLYWMNFRTDNGNKYLDVRGYTLNNNTMTMKSLGQWTLEPYGSPW
jgi:hypothetical protein